MSKINYRLDLNSIPLPDARQYVYNRNETRRRLNRQIVLSAAAAAGIIVVFIAGMQLADYIHGF
jgi:hypothetical protein